MQHSKPFRLLTAIFVTGIATGLAGALSHWVLCGVEWLVFGYVISDGWAGVGLAPVWRRLALPIIPALLGGIIWWRLRRRYETGQVPAVSEAVAGTELKADSVLDAFTQVSMVASGVSVGREAAPRQVAAWAGQRISSWLHITESDSADLVAGAAGAGLTAVYNTPLAGTAMTMVLLSKKPARTWRRFFICLALNAIAMVVSWSAIGTGPTYLIPHISIHQHASDYAIFFSLALILALLSAFCGLGFTAFMDQAKAKQSKPHHLVWTVPLAMVVVSIVALWLPQVIGNGYNQVELMLSQDPSWQIILALLFAKVLVTALSLRLGAVGGLLTPALATGASLGALAALLVGFSSRPSLFGWTTPNAEMTDALVIVGMVAIFAVTQKSAIFGSLFVIELCRPSLWLVAVIMAVAATSSSTARLVKSKLRKSSRNE